MFRLFFPSERLQVATTKMSKAIPGTAKRTIVLDIEAYNEILKFFQNSPSGITGAAAIRELVRQFGMYCKEKRHQNIIASSRDFGEIPNIVLKAVGETADEHTN